MEISLIPTYLLNKIQIDDQSKIHLNIFITNFFILLFLLSMSENLGLINSLPHFCLSKSVLDLSCPGCGITSGIISLSNFNFQNAINHNPASILLFAFFFLQLPLRIIALIRKDLSTIMVKVSKNMSYIVIMGLLISWILNFN